MDTLLKELGRRCLEYSPDTFQYIGTAAVVRDMIALHDVLEGSDKPLNFWGVSYGTVVGSYFINSRYQELHWICDHTDVDQCSPIALAKSYSMALWIQCTGPIDLLIW
jgi:hypothetical protein